MRIAASEHARPVRLHDLERSAPDPAEYGETYGARNLPAPGHRAALAE
jgi:hypothetical protein